MVQTWGSQSYEQMQARDGGGMGYGPLDLGLLSMESRPKLLDSIDVLFLFFRLGERDLIP